MLYSIHMSAFVMNIEFKLRLFAIMRLTRIIECNGGARGAQAKGG